MRIGLIDVDGHNFPNLPLMKLSAYHKQQGDQVEWYEPLFTGHCRRVYMSKVFTFTQDYEYYVDADEIIKGGTGYFYPDGGEGLPETLSLAAERLKGVQIENLPALELINRYDTDDVFMYIDPPYLHGTRKGFLYKHEMKDPEHEELLKTLMKHPGKILLSGYDNELYNDYLHGWDKAYKQTNAEGGLARTEVLWMNYRKDMQMTFADIPGVMP